MKQLALSTSPPLPRRTPLELRTGLGCFTPLRVEEASPPAPVSQGPRTDYLPQTLDDAAIKQASQLREKLLRLLFRRDTTISQNERETILALFDEQTDVVLLTCVENARLRGRLEERGPIRPSSYAAAARVDLPVASPRPAAEVPTASTQTTSRPPPVGTGRPPSANVAVPPGLIN